MKETNPTTFPIHIRPHHLRLSPALSEFARDKFAKVPRFASDVLAAEVILRRHHGTSEGKRFSASGRLAIAGRDIHASATHADLYTAIVMLVARLARRSRKRKTRLAKTHSTPRPSSLKPSRLLRGHFTGASPRMLPSGPIRERLVTGAVDKNNAPSDSGEPRRLPFTARKRVTHSIKL